MTSNLIRFCSFYFILNSLALDIGCKRLHLFIRTKVSDTGRSSMSQLIVLIVSAGWKLLGMQRLAVAMPWLWGRCTATPEESAHLNTCPPAWGSCSPWARTAPHLRSRYMLTSCCSTLLGLLCHILISRCIRFFRLVKHLDRRQAGLAPECVLYSHLTLENSSKK